MPETKENLLIVDDEPSIRATLSWALTDLGYSVRTAEDGFSALIEIRKQIPDIVLSDLNMPGMSGFEFLSVVRRRFPSIPLIAMSGAFRGDEAPSGVAADAFFQKGGGLRALLKILEGLPRPERLSAWIAPSKAPLSIQLVRGSLSVVREANCVHCRNPIYYTIIEPVDWVPARVLRRSDRHANSLVLLHSRGRNARKGYFYAQHR